MGTGLTAALITLVLLVGGQQQPVPPSREPDLGEQTEVKSNDLIVRTDQLAYRLGEAIQVEVANGLPFTIYSSTHQTNCSFVTLEWWSGSRWIRLSYCGIGAPTASVPIGTGRRRAALVSTDIKNLNTGSALAKAGLREFPPGNFRILFSFRLDTRLEARPFFVTFSRMFSVSAND
jgi:hypothetical protein